MSDLRVIVACSLMLLQAPRSASAQENETEEADSSSNGASGSGESQQGEADAERATPAQSENANTPTPPNRINDLEKVTARARYTRDRANACHADRDVDAVDPPSELSTEEAEDEQRLTASGRDCASIEERADDLEARELELRRARDERVHRLLGWGRTEIRLAVVAQVFSLTANRRSFRPREYEVAVLAPSFSLLILYRPCGARRSVASGDACPGKTVENETVQIWSIGFNIVLGIDSNGGGSHFGLGLAMMFLDDIFGFSVGVDLYRRVTLDDERADTGLLAEALATEGEFTPENVWLGLLFNIEGGLSALGRL